MRHPLLIALMWVVAVGGTPPDSMAETGTDDPRGGAPGEATPGISLSGGVGERDAVEVVEGRGGEREELKTEIRALRGRVERLEEGLAASLRALHIYALPATMEFAGERVPFDRWDVGERLEREFLLSVGNRAQVVLWLKRSARYFPYIQSELRKAGLPDDLKYVAVIESALLPTAYSHASALGIWQFIPATGRRYGLAVTPWWDERRNPESSTAAALAYLKDLYARFRNWPLALAGYNAGEARVEQALRQQGVSSYYQLALPTETERYVFRALAAKLILSQPERYGFQVQTEQLYRPHEADVVQVQVRDRLLVADLAKAGGSFYREIKELNAEILHDYLPKGQYLIRIPKGRATQFVANVSALQPPAAGRPGWSVRYQVR